MLVITHQFFERKRFDVLYHLQEGQLTMQAQENVAVEALMMQAQENVAVEAIGKAAQY